MKNFAKRALAMFVALVMCLSVLSGIAVTASAVSYIYNWGERGELATELSDNAVAFYEDNNVTYSDLAALSGNSSQSSAHTSALYTKLKSLMTGAQHTVTSYSDTTDLFMYTDCQNGGGKISSFYSGKEIGPSWDSGSTWNREHTWPNSKGDASGDGENDIMMLRPTSVTENSSRGNKAYGESSGYYDPNEVSNGKYNLHGDVARIMLYVYVRWGNTANMWGTSGVIESKEVLLDWMEEDPVDTWELGRNDAVEAITGTRNVFVDYPELAFDLFNAEIPIDMTTPSAGIPTANYTVIATSSNESYGTVAVDGHTITATVVNNSYTIDGYTVTGGEADVVRSGDVFAVYPKSDCTVQINFRKRVETTLTFSDAAGKAAADEICELEGTTVTLPQYAGTSYDTHTFVGWVETAVDDTTEAPVSLQAGRDYILNSDTNMLALYTYTTAGVTYYSTSVGCVHENTTTTGAKDATCTSAGYTGDRVCTDCGKTLQTGTAIAVTDHTYVDGTCSCGAVQPKSYTLTDIASISATDQVIITVTTEGGTTYALSSSNGTSSAPTAVPVTVSGDSIAADASITDSILWNVVSATDGYTFYPNGNTAKWLYCTSSNNGVRVGTNTANTFVVDSASGYLKHNGTSRYLGVYTTNPDWRCYTSPTGQNIVNQTLGFYALAASSGDSSCTHASTELQGKVEATCTAAGFTGNTVCTACGAIVSSGSAVEALGHTDANGDNACDTCGAAVGVVYTKIDLADITAAHQVIITMTNASGTVYAIPNNGGTSAPAATAVTVTNDTISTEDTTLLWNIVNEDGVLTIYPNGDTSKWLYCTNANNGVRVGAGEASAFQVDSTYGYLFNTTHSRYVGVYNNQDWRCYTTTPDGSNIKEQTLGFYAYKDTGVTACEHTNKTVTETVDATCLATGYVKETCNSCAQEFITTLAATGHSFADGICSVCGAEEGTGEAVTYVGVLMNTAPVTGDVIFIGNGANIMADHASGAKIAYESGTINGGTLTLTDTVAILEVAIDENGYYTFYNEENQGYLTSAETGNGLSFAEKSDYSLWTVASAGNGLFYIKNVNAAYNGNKNQSLEFYSGFTTYGHKDTAIYQMSLYKRAELSDDCQHSTTTVTGAKEATCNLPGYTGNTVCASCGHLISQGEVIESKGHTMVEGICSVCGVATMVTEPQAGTAYKWGIEQNNLGKTLYFAGSMNGYYGATTDSYAEATDVYLEEAEGGYHVTFTDAEGAKKYVNAVQNGDYNNFIIADAAETVYAYDEAHNTLTAALGETTCYIGTYSNYSTFSVSLYDKIANSFPAHFYTIAEVADEPDWDIFESAKPAVTVTADPVTGGSILSWEAVADATYYEIHRATSKNGTYTQVNTTEDTQYVALEAPGKSAYYKVRAIYEGSDLYLRSQLSDYAKVTGKCAMPVVTAENDVETGRVKLSWEKVSGAKKYEVYRATSETGKYSKLTTTSKTTYTDSKGSVGKTYFYKVRAVASSSKYNSAYSEILSAFRICAQVELSVKLDKATGKPVLSWNKVSGATGYEILRCLPDDVDFMPLYQQTGTTYTDTTAPVDTMCEYIVIARGSAAEFDSAMSETAAIAAGLARPQLEGALTSTGRPSISWEAVEGAQSYIIYRSTKSSKSYKQINETTDLFFTDEEASGGKAYYYKVVAVGANSESDSSSYKKLTGKCVAPVVSAENNGESGRVRLSWEKVSGAKKYYVYRSTSLDGKYTKLTSTTKAYYTDSKGTLGTEYFYKVVAVASSSKYNSYDSNIVSGMRVCARPEVKVTVDKYTGNLTISWDKVSGAGDYTVYCSQNGGEFVELFTGSGTKFTDDSVIAGNRYQYAVQAVVDGNEDLNSAMGISKEVLATCARPSITGTRSDAGKPQISWEADEEAERYVIYRSTKSSGGYKELDTTDDVSYTDETAKAGKTYYYKVVAVAGESESTISSYVKIKSK